MFICAGNKKFGLLALPDNSYSKLRAILHTRALLLGEFVACLGEHINLYAFWCVSLEHLHPKQGHLVICFFFSEEQLAFSQLNCSFRWMFHLMHHWIPPHASLDLLQAYTGRLSLHRTLYQTLYNREWLSPFSIKTSFTAVAGGLYWTWIFRTDLEQKIHFFRVQGWDTPHKQDF